MLFKLRVVVIEVFNRVIGDVLDFLNLVTLAVQILKKPMNHATKRELLREIHFVSAQVSLQLHKIHRGLESLAFELLNAFGNRVAFLVYFLNFSFVLFVFI